MIIIEFVDEDDQDDEEGWTHELPAVPQRGDWVSLRRPTETGRLYRVVRAVWYPEETGAQVNVYVTSKETP